MQRSSALVQCNATGTLHTLVFCALKYPYLAYMSWYWNTGLSGARPDILYDYIFLIYCPHLSPGIAGPARSGSVILLLDLSYIACLSGAAWPVLLSRRTRHRYAIKAQADPDLDLLSCCTRHRWVSRWRLNELRAIDAQLRQVLPYHQIPSRVGRHEEEMRGGVKGGGR